MNRDGHRVVGSVRYSGSHQQLPILPASLVRVESEMVEGERTYPIK
jgi:hypothetical protein